MCLSLPYPYDRLRPRVDSARSQNARFGNTKFGPQIVMQNSITSCKSAGVIASAISRSGKCSLPAPREVLRSPASSPLFSPRTLFEKLGMTGKRNACVVNAPLCTGPVISAANSPFRQPSTLAPAFPPHNAHFQPLTAPHDRFT